MHPISSFAFPTGCVSLSKGTLFLRVYQDDLTKPLWEFHGSGLLCKRAQCIISHLIFGGLLSKVNRSFSSWTRKCVALLLNPQLVQTLSLLLCIDQGWYPDLLIAIREKIYLKMYYSMNVNSIFAIKVPLFWLVQIIKLLMCCNWL